MLFGNKEIKNGHAQKIDLPDLPDFLTSFCIPKNIDGAEFDDLLFKVLMNNDRIYRDMKTLSSSLTDTERHNSQDMFGVTGYYFSREAQFLDFKFRYDRGSVVTTKRIDGKEFFLTNYLIISYKEQKIVTIQELVQSHYNLAEEEQDNYSPEPMYNIVEHIPELTNYGLFVAKYIVDNAYYCHENEKQKIIEEVKKLICER